MFAQGAGNRKFLISRGFMSEDHPSETPTMSSMPSQFPSMVPSSKIPTTAPTITRSTRTTQGPTTQQPITDTPPETITAGFYVVIPPGTQPEEVAWDIRQGSIVVESAGYGTYNDHGVHFERANVQADQDYAFVLNVESGTGNGETCIFGSLNDKRSASSPLKLYFAFLALPSISTIGIQPVYRR